MRIRTFVSFFLALLVVGAVLYTAEHSFRQRATPSPTPAQIPAPAQTASSPQVDNRPAAILSNSDTANNGSVIMKCTINGRTVYSDHQCRGRHAESVEIHATDGIDGDAKLISERRETASRQISVQSRDASVMTVKRSNECWLIEEQLAQIDRIEKQKTDANTRHWVAKERARLKSHRCMGMMR